MSENKPKVFISYSWDSPQHKEKVNSLVANNLIKNGIEVLIDSQYPLTPPGGWTSWMRKSLKESDFIIIIWTEDYLNKYEGNVPPEEGLGVKWESRLIMTNIHAKADVSKYINIIFDKDCHRFVTPEIDASRYLIENCTQVEELSTRIKDTLALKPKVLTLDINDKIIEEFKDYLHSSANISVKTLIKIALQYLPINYSKKLPEDINSLIDELLYIGVLPESNCVPVISTFAEICTISFDAKIESWIKYLKENKFSHISSFEYIKTVDISEISLLIMFSVNNNTYSVTIWRYGIDGCIKDSYSEEEIDFGDELGIKNFFNKLNEYIDSELEPIYGENINIEIILPKKKMSQNIKLIRDISNDILVNKFKIIFRIESRFKKPNQTWKNKWIKIQEDNGKLLKYNSKIITSGKYNNEMSNMDSSVIIQSEIGDYNALLNDVLTYGIPIVLSGISKSLADNFISEIVDNITILDCKKSVGEYIMGNRHSDDSRLFLIYDDPNRIPEDYKKPNFALYDL